MDLKKIFSEGLEGFLSDLINDALGKFDCFLGNIVNLALHADKYMNSNKNMSFDEFYKTIYLFGIYLIILKFLKKSFNTYVLWTEGDPDMETVTMAMNYFKALVVAISYSTVYDVCTKIADDMINKSLSSFNNVSLDKANLLKLAIAGLLNNGLTMIIIALIYVVLFIVLWIQFIKRGLELFILKAGMPLACVGLIDTDGGVFKVYCKKITQELLTVFVQIVMLKLSLVFMINKHFMFGIAAMNFALKAPAFLSEFIMMSSSGGGAMSKVSQTSMLIRNLKK